MRVSDGDDGEGVDDQRLLTQSTHSKVDSRGRHQDHGLRPPDSDEKEAMTFAMEVMLKSRR
jgi:hypothetical protein